MNSCPCGWRADVHDWSAFVEIMVTNCQKRIFETLLDRMDIHIEVLRIDHAKLSNDQVRSRANRFWLVCKRQMHCRLSQADDGLDNTQSGFMVLAHEPGLHLVCHDYSQNMISAVLRSTG